MPALIPFFATTAAVFLLNLSFFGFVSQFIFRFKTLTGVNRWVSGKWNNFLIHLEFQTKNVSKFLLLNLSEAFSAKKYFGMFALIAVFPLVYTLLCAYSGFPLKEQNFDKRALQNESLVVFLELNLTDVQQFNFFIPNGQVWILTFPLTAIKRHLFAGIFIALNILLSHSCHSWLLFSTMR